MFGNTSRKDKRMSKEKVKRVCAVNVTNFLMNVALKI